MNLNRKGKRQFVEEASKKWWQSLQAEPTKDGRKKLPGNRAALAKLRRASDPLAAASEPMMIALFQRLSLLREGASEKEKIAALSRVAVLASVLAHVRDDSKDKVGRALGPTDMKKPETALLKPLRLARLLAARGDEEIGTQFRRVVALLGGKADVGNLAWLILSWDQDETGDRTRTLFAFDYHDAGAHAPAVAYASETGTIADTAPVTSPSAA